MMLTAKNTFIFRPAIKLQNATLGVHSCLSNNGLYSSNNNELWLPRQLTCRLHPVAALRCKHDCAGFLMISGFNYKLINTLTMLQFPKQWPRMNIATRSQLLINWMVDWSTSNHMNINSRKTKEKIMGPTRKQTASPVMISEETIEQVTSFKLHGVTVTDSLR